MQFQPPYGVGSAALLVIMLAGAPSWAAEPTDDAGALLSPDAAVAASLTTHSQVRAASAALQQARGARAEVGLFLNNPQVSASYSLPGGDRSSASISQAISLSGEGWHARRAWSARVASGEAWLLRSQLEVAAETRLAYIDAVVASGRVQLAEDGVELIERLHHAVTRQNEEGEASALEVRLAGLAKVHATSELLDARETQSTALRVLAAYTGRVVSSENLASDTTAIVPEPSAGTAGERSDVVAARESVRAAEAGLRRQRAASVPVVGVGAAVNVEDGQSFVGPTISMTLPIFGRNQSGRTAAKGELDVAEAMHLSVSAVAKTEKETATVRAREAQEVAESMNRDPIADAKSALAGVEAGYLAGEIDLPSTVLLQREILDGQSAAIELLGRIGAANLDLMLVTEDSALLGGAQ